jgi:hypothetical protein
VTAEELERAGDEMERRAQRTLARARRDLAAYAFAFMRDHEPYTPMTDARPTRLEHSVLEDHGEWAYLYERTAARPPTPEEEAYYEDRRRSGAWPDLYATPDLPGPAQVTRRQPAPAQGSRAGEPKTPGSNANDEGRAFGGLNNAPDLPGLGLPDDRRDAVGAHVDRPATGEPDATGPEPCPPAGPVAQDLPGPHGTQGDPAAAPFEAHETRAGEPDDEPPALDKDAEKALERFNALHDAQPAEDGDPE